MDSWDIAQNPFTSSCSNIVSEHSSVDEKEGDHNTDEESESM